MLLAAGKGSRIKSLCKGSPKVLLEVGGKSLLEHNLRLLKKHGVKKVMVNTHHRAFTIRNFLEKNRSFGLKISFSHEKNLMGTAGGVKKAEYFFQKKPFFVLYGDNVTDFNLHALEKTYRKSKPLAVLGVFDPEKVKHSGVLAGHICVNANKKVLSFSEKRSGRRAPSGTLINAGVMLLNPRILKWIPSFKACDFSKDLFPKLLARGETILTDSHVTKVLACDTPQAFKKTKAIFKKETLQMRKLS